MDKRIEQEEIEAVGGSGFDFEKAESLLSGDKSSDYVEDEQTIEGEVQTAEDRAKLQSRSIVGLMDIAFKAKDSEHSYGEPVYKDGERHIAPALIRLNIDLPAFEVVNAVIWLITQAMKSIKGIKLRRAEKKEVAGNAE